MAASADVRIFTDDADAAGLIDLLKKLKDAAIQAERLVDTAGEEEARQDEFAEIAAYLRGKETIYSRELLISFCQSNCSDDCFRNALSAMRVRTLPNCDGHRDGIAGWIVMYAGVPGPRNMAMANLMQTRFRDQVSDAELATLFAQARS